MEPQRWWFVRADRRTAPGYYTRASDTLVNRTRGLFSFDVRSQTEYGTLRSYVRAGWQWTTNTDSIGGSSTSRLS